MAQHHSRLRKATEVRRCSVCGCTENNACIYQEIEEGEEGPVTRDVACYWIAADLCSNPECLAKVTVSVGGAGVPIFG